MKVVAIFGGSGGLGGHVVRRVARDHAVLIGYRSGAEKAQTLVEELKGEGRHIVAAPVDIRRLDSVQAFLDQAAMLGSVGGIVSVCGAPFPMCALTDASVEEFRDVMETEVSGTFNIFKCAVPLLKKNGGGSLVAFLTTAVLRTMDYDALNSVPKAAIAMMVRHVAREAGRDNVRVNAVAPGVIDAGRTDLVAQLPPLVQKVVADCLANTPLPRLGKPSEIAGLVQFLLSEDAGYINGQIIGLDGGYSA
jgi:3-oxoacyl-[acyl-carrier protein] reductase